MIMGKKLLAVTASDTVDDPNGPFNGGVIVGAAGNATILCKDDSTARTFTGLLVGSHLQLVVKRVNAGGLTATLYGVKI